MSAPIYMKQDADPDSYCDNRLRTDPIEREIIDAWDAAATLAESSDPEADYSFCDYALIQIGDVFYVTNASGCSCPSQSEVWCVGHRGDRDSTVAFISAETDSGYWSEAWHEFQRAVAAIGWPVPSPAKSGYDGGFA